MIEVLLSSQELYVASMVGLRRRIASMSACYSERNGANRLSNAEAWFMNIVGAQGEMAAAKALGVYWPASINAPKREPDLLPDWQVRTLAQHHYELLVRSDDMDSHRYILVTGDGPSFQVHGWILGRDAKRQEWVKDRGGRGAPAFWVPQANLVPLV